jgi:hypothetical protein
MNTHTVSVGRPSLGGGEMSELYFVFDVESLGLHGIGFAFGFVVVDADGNELDSGYAAIKPDLVGADQETLEFLGKNVFPALWGYTHQIPEVLTNGESKNGAQVRTFREFRTTFWQKWLEWKEKGALMVSDCAWPGKAPILSLTFRASF